MIKFNEKFSLEKRDSEPLFYTLDSAFEEFEDEQIISIKGVIPQEYFEILQYLKYNFKPFFVKSEKDEKMQKVGVLYVYTDINSKYNVFDNAVYGRIQIMKFSEKNLINPEDLCIKIPSFKFSWLKKGNTCNTAIFDVKKFKPTLFDYFVNNAPFLAKDKDTENYVFVEIKNLISQPDIDALGLVLEPIFIKETNEIVNKILSK